VCNLWGTLSRAGTLAACALLLWTPSPVLAQEQARAGVVAARALTWPVASVARARPTLLKPMVVARGSGKLGSPVFTRGALWTASPRRLRGLATVEKPGRPCHDATSRAWYASANGCLVRVETGGSLPVLVCGVQGVDVHVRATRGLAVSREPDHRVVLHRFGRGGTGRRTLLRGWRFFDPRLSPDGSRVLVSESRPGGGHVWMVDLRGTARDLGPGHGPAWHPDGRRVILSRVRHDGSRVLGADLWQVDVVTGRATRLARTAAVAETDPTVSPNGRWLAYVDARSGDLLVARLPGGRP